MTEDSSKKTEASKKKIEASKKNQAPKSKQPKKPYQRKHKKPVKQVRRVIGGLHLRLEENGKRSLSTDQEFFWEIGKYTDNEGDRLVDGFPELGRIAVVETKYGWRPVVVVREQTVTGEAAVKAADELKYVRRFTKNDVHTYHVVRPFKKFLKENNIQDPRELKKKKQAEAAKKAEKADK